MFSVSIDVVEPDSHKTDAMEYVPLRSFDNYIEANIVLNMLQHYDINCHLKDENIITIDSLLSPALGGMKLMVHEAHVARAWDLIDNAEAEYLKTIPCPICKARALQTISIKKRTQIKIKRNRQHAVEWPVGRAY